MRRRENRPGIGAEGVSHEDAVGSRPGRGGGKAQRRDLSPGEWQDGLERHCFPSPESATSTVAVVARGS